jgi:hypothetical protein
VDQAADQEDLVAFWVVEKVLPVALEQRKLRLERLQAAE